VTNMVAWRHKAQHRINRSTLSADEKRTQCADVQREADGRFNRSRSQLPWARVLQNTENIWRWTFSEADAECNIPNAVHYFNKHLAAGQAVQHLFSQEWVRHAADVYHSNHWWRESFVPRPVSLWYHMGDSDSVRTTALTNVNCSETMDNATPAINVIQFYNFTGATDADAEHVCTTWKDKALILAVRVQSSSVNVAVKVAKFNGSDSNLLARALAKQTHTWYGSGTLDVVRHKKSLEDYGEYGTTYLAESNADRPAFVIKEIQDGGRSSHLLHCYGAMQQPNEHALQQTLLARCKNPLMAASPPLLYSGYSANHKQAPTTAKIDYWKRRVPSPPCES